MNLKSTFKQHWLLFFFAGVGYYDFFVNDALPSLIAAILISIFLVALMQQVKISGRLLGVVLVAAAVWGIIDNAALVDSRGIREFILKLAFGGLGLLLLFDKLNKLFENPRIQRVTTIVVSLGFVAYIYATFLDQKDLDILEIAIMVVAALFVVVVALPERKR